jgi:hypothetical protein
MKIRFFRQCGKWYADMAHHALEENEMVSGADVVLEMLANGRDGVVLELETTEPRAHLLHLHIAEHDEYGATYSVTGCKYNQMMEAMAEGGIEPFSEVWLCNVTHDAFGEHPHDIFVTKIE